MGRKKITDTAARERARERRRLQTREAMQRLRERQHQTIERLRGTVDALEATYSNLLRQVELRQFSQPSGSELSWPLPWMELEEAKRHVQTLAAANAELHRAIDERVRWEDHVALMLEYLNADASTGGIDEPSPFSALDFVPSPRLSESRAMKLMLIHRRKQEAISREWLRAKRAPYMSEFLGWEIHYFPHGRYWYLKFTKQFRDVSAQEVSRRAWAHAQRLVGYRSRLPSRRIVQRINENAIVFARWTAERDHFIQSNQVTYILRFRVEEPDGSIGIGLQTVPAPGEQDALDDEQFLTEDECLYIKLATVKDQATGAEHCVAEYSGRTQFGDPAYAQRNALELVISLARWEDMNVATSSFAW